LESKDEDKEMKARKRQIRFGHKKHLHSQDIFSDHWLRPYSKIQAEIFPRFSYGFFLGISIALLFQWWR
jgi:hypothetical protein